MDINVQNNVPKRIEMGLNRTPASARHSHRSVLVGPPAANSKLYTGNGSDSPSMNSEFLERRPSRSDKSRQKHHSLRVLQHRL